ncbi:MAG: DNA polymerase III subunit alpha [Thermodesulfobacteriota bacterium]
MSADFVHLHLHSQYSLLDGAIRFPDLLGRCREFGMDTVAVTDHGAMYGTLEFYLAAKKAGIKPIIGSEFYIAPGSRFDRNARSAGEAAFHLVLLAMNEEGYRNLCRLSGIAMFEGFYYKARIDKEVLAAHSNGLIAMSACLHGEIPYLLAKEKNPAAARQAAREMLEIFGDRFYLEIQENGIPEQKIANDGVVAIGRELGIELVATNDCHYLNREDAHAHEVLLCIQTGKTIHDKSRFRFSTDELYFKSPEEMRRSFAWCPEAVANTVKVAARCNLELAFGENHFPIFPVPEGESLDSVFEKAARKGLQQRLLAMGKKQKLTAEIEKNYHDRLEMEIGVIKQMGFPGYFLIVADFINWAKDHGIPVGPGRGSGAGSLAAYAMRITDIDPIPYGLIFERFLNIERKSMPDVDVDFCQERRGEVIQYVHDKYGGDRHVAQIITYGSMKARAVIRDVGRALGMSFAEVDRIAKLVPEGPKVTVAGAMKDEPRLEDAAKHDGQVGELLRVAQVLEGLPRHTSTHAAGVVISPREMVEHLPVARGPKGEVLTQYDMKCTEKTGLIKFDFLGLKTLTVIDRAVKLIEKAIGAGFDIANIPLDDPKTYDLLCRGDALGVFQLESSGMRDLLVKMKPELFTDLIALVALYRPGPLESGMVDDFIDTKHGRKAVSYPLPQLETILEETYGVIVYQEQVMKIANVLADYSLGDADILRRAMGKKDPAVMAAEKDKFMAGALKNKVPQDKAEYIFDLMAKFAGYGFNKSHSAAYALISYQTAYLKTHYPAQFMAALLSCDVSNTDKVVRYINECKDHGIEVLPPDINESDADFTVVAGRIRFGLAAVKNVGGTALDSIIEERGKDGPYDSLEDFCARIDSRKVNRRVAESLIKAGAFDSFGARRSQLFAILDAAMEQAQAAQRDKQSGQISLFSMVEDDNFKKASRIPLPEVAEWDESQKLAFEKETVGFYITGHPLDRYRRELQMVSDAASSDLGEWLENQPVRIGGLVKHLKEHKTKKDEKMAFLTLEDASGEVEVLIFPAVYARAADLLGSDGPIVVAGSTLREERGVKVIAEEVLTLEEARSRFTARTHIMLKAAQLNRGRLESLRKLLRQHPGPCPLSLTVHFDQRGEVDLAPPEDFTVRPGSELARDAGELLGYEAVRYIKTVLQPRQGHSGFKNGQRQAAG